MNWTINSDSLEAALIFGTLWVSMMFLGIMLVGVAVNHWLKNDNKVVALTTMGSLVTLNKYLVYIFICLFAILVGYFNLYLGDYSSILVIAQLTIMLCLLANQVMVSYSFYEDSLDSLTYHENRLADNMFLPYSPNYRFFEVVADISLIAGIALASIALYLVYIGKIETQQTKLSGMIYDLNTLIACILFMHIRKKVFTRKIAAVAIFAIIAINVAYTILL